MGTAICKGMCSLLAKQSQHLTTKAPFVSDHTQKGAHPFKTIAMDWIMKLPPSNGYDSILIITNHDCSKAVLFIPCKEAMGTKELAKLYFNRVVQSCHLLVCLFIYRHFTVKLAISEYDR